jgi:hypothetical protein
MPSRLAALCRPAGPGTYHTPGRSSSDRRAECMRGRLFRQRAAARLERPGRLVRGLSSPFVATSSKCDPSDRQDSARCGLASPLIEPNLALCGAERRPSGVSGLACRSWVCLGLLFGGAVVFDGARAVFWLCSRYFFVACFRSFPRDGDLCTAAAARAFMCRTCPVIAGIASCVAREARRLRPEHVAEAGEARRGVRIAHREVWRLTRRKERKSCAPEIQNVPLFVPLFLFRIVGTASSSVPPHTRATRSAWVGLV